MRDYRDAKAIAHTLREALVDKNCKITVGESLELVARLFGAGDWNTLSALIKNSERGQVPPRPFEQGPAPLFASPLEDTLFRSVGAARDRDHREATVEHLLLSLTDDPDAVAIMKACGGDLGGIKDLLYRSSEIANAGDPSFGGEPTPSENFQRVVQRAILDAQRLGGGAITGAHILVAIFSEENTTAVRILHEQGIKRSDAARMAANRRG